MGFQRILPILNFNVKTNFAIYPILQYPKAHFSNIPAFHHSNLGEAPNLISMRGFYVRNFKDG